MNRYCTGAQCTKARSAGSEVSLKENAVEGMVFSRAFIFWHFELKPEIFHPHKKNYIKFMNRRAFLGLLKSS